MSDAFFALDRKWRCSYVNGAPEQIGRLAREQMLQRSVWICFHTQFESALRGAINDGATVRFEEYCEHLDAWFGGMATLRQLV